MPDPFALLASTTPAVIDPIAKICSSPGGLPLTVCPDLDTAVHRLGQQNVVLVLAHLPAIGDTAGVQQLLRAVAVIRRPCATVVLADSCCENQAAAVLRAGAAEYLQLPLDLSKFQGLINAFTRRIQAVGTAATSADHSSLENTEDDGLGVLMGQVKRVAPQDTTLLLTGTTGTGKTRLARLIHDLSPRRQLPFLVADCGSLSPALIESELFGHARGAFTGADRERSGKLAAAAGGTLLLDEINSLPLPLQSKLLRAVDARVFQPVGSNREQPLRARLIAASNVSLEEEVAAGRFRSDLYYRLNVVGFFLPPLSERRAAIAPLASRFLTEFAARNRPDILGFTAEALLALRAYDWPGNVRELRNVVERALALCDGPEVTLHDLPEAMRGMQDVGQLNPTPNEESPPYPAPFAYLPSNPTEEPPAVSAPFTLHQTRREVEIRRIREALHKHKNNRLRAAAELGISRVGLYKKLHQYGMITPRGKNNEPQPAAIP